MKAVIPAAGLGTRFLPYTRAQPKEMLPVLDKPVLQYVVEEAVRSGILDILVITGRGKRAIEDHFDRNPELEQYLRARGMHNELAEMSRLLAQARIAYVRQGEPSGLGHAVLCAETAVGNEPFGVLLGDDITLSRIPCIKSLMVWHRKLGASCIAAQIVDWKDVNRYGMILGEEVADNLFQVRGIVEKPSPAEVKSRMVSIGRYLLTPTIFRHLRNLRPGKGGEIWLTDGLRALLRSEDLYAWIFNGRRFDIGSKEGWLLANLELAWGRKEYRGAIRSMLGKLTR